MAQVKLTIRRGYYNMALYINGVLVAGTRPFGGGTAVDYIATDKIILDALKVEPPKKDT